MSKNIKSSDRVRFSSCGLVVLAHSYACLCPRALSILSAGSKNNVPKVAFQQDDLLCLFWKTR